MWGSHFENNRAGDGYGYDYGFGYGYDVAGTQEGGAMYATANSTITVSDSTFQHNAAPSGNGGALAIYSHSSVSGSSFIGNSALQVISTIAACAGRA